MEVVVHLSLQFPVPSVLCTYLETHRCVHVCACTWDMYMYGKMHGGNQGTEWMEVIERSTGTAVIHWFGVLYV